MNSSKKILVYMALACVLTAAKPGMAETAASLKDPHRLRNRGKIHADRDTRAGYVDAGVYFKRLLELEPDGVSDRLNYAKVLLLGGDPRGCDRELARARTLLGGAEAPAALEYVARFDPHGP